MHARYSPRRIRISLGVSLLLTTLVAAAAGLAAQYWQIESLRAEVRKLREEQGQLVFDDPNQLHAIRVATHSPYSWRFRVWLPKDKRYYLTADRVEKPGRINGWLIEGSGEHLIEVHAEQQEDDEPGEPDIVISTTVDGLRSASIAIPTKSALDFMDEEYHWEGVRFSTESCPADVPVVLLSITDRQQYGPSEPFCLWVGAD